MYATYIVILAVAGPAGIVLAIIAPIITARARRRRQTRTSR
jgi:hypothetical protein